jgi:hypothetical protein
MDNLAITWFGWWGHLATQAAWIIQLGLIVHALRTGRSYWWCAVLLFMPVIGGLAYVVVELLPEISEGGRYSFINSLKPRSLIIQQMKAELAESDTVERRLDLATELFLAGKTQEAHDVAAECLHGVFHNDPHLLVQLVRYKLELGRGEEALAMLETIKGKLDRRVELTIVLLRARAYQLLGRNAEAVELLQPLVSGYLGEEPRYFLGVALAGSGHRDEACVIWRDIKTKFRKANKLWRRSEKRWYKLAGERLREKTS